MQIPHITEAELEILHILWDRKEASVKEVHELLIHKDAGYTTVLKQMQLMMEKGLLNRDESKRQHIYRAAVEKDKIQGRFMDKLMNTFFKGSASQMILQALNGGYKTTPEEMEAIEELIKNAKKNSK